MRNGYTEPLSMIVWLVELDNCHRYGSESQMPAHLTLNVVALGSMLLIGAFGAQLANAAEKRTVESYSCKQVMRESGVNRSSAIAFLHGFVLGKSGNSTFSIETLTKQTDAFIDSCLDNPAAKALDTMMKVKG